MFSSGSLLLFAGVVSGVSRLLLLLTAAAAAAVAAHVMCCTHLKYAALKLPNTHVINLHAYAHNNSSTRGIFQRDIGDRSRVFFWVAHQ